jgi:hypothetical protein
MGGIGDLQTAARTTSYIEKAIQLLFGSIRGDAHSCGRVNLLLL